MQDPQSSCVSPSVAFGAPTPGARSRGQRMLSKQHCPSYSVQAFLSCYPMQPASRAGGVTMLPQRPTEMTHLESACASRLRSCGCRGQRRAEPRSRPMEASTAPWRKQRAKYTIFGDFGKVLLTNVGTPKVALHSVRYVLLVVAAQPTSRTRSGRQAQPIGHNSGSMARRQEAGNPLHVTLFPGTVLV